jgi:predicted Zn finger-like uncharacterized protein
MKKRRGSGRHHAHPALDGPPAPSESPTLAEPGRRLYTQCPGCQTVYLITLAQLRASRGEAQCQECQTHFNCLASLAENPARARPHSAPPKTVMLGKLDAAASKPEAPEPSPVIESFDPEPSETVRAHRSKHYLWGGGAVVALALFSLQLGLFKGPQWAQNEQYRPWLEAACQILRCQLPPYHNIPSIQVISHDLRPASNGADAYEFVLVLVNQASLPQAFPSITLNLATDTGSPLATRVFDPADYRPKDGEDTMPVGKLQEIHILLAKPQQDIGGFSFDLH